jgi:hypothetical protein
MRFGSQSTTASPDIQCPSSLLGLLNPCLPDRSVSANRLEATCKWEPTLRFAGWLTYTERQTAGPGYS